MCIRFAVAAGSVAMASIAAAASASPEGTSIDVFVWYQTRDADFMNPETVVTHTATTARRRRR